MYSKTWKFSKILVVAYADREDHTVPRTESRHPNVQPWRPPHLSDTRKTCDDGDDVTSNTPSEVGDPWPQNNRETSRRSVLTHGGLNCRGSLPQLSRPSVLYGRTQVSGTTGETHPRLDPKYNRWSPQLVTTGVVPNVVRGRRTV